MRNQVYASGVLSGADWTARWAVSADLPAAHVAPQDWWVDETGLANLVGAAQAAVTGSVHGAGVAQVERAGLAQGCDAIVTTQAGLALVTLAADCVPVVLADPHAGCFAAVHCGWQGLTVGVVTQAVRTMVDGGARTITAVVGPSICADCYPVPAQRVDQVRDSVATAVAVEACFDDPARIAVGPGVVAELSALRAEGIERIEVVSGCTAEEPRLFTYRGTGTMHRHAMVIAGFRKGD